MKPRLRPARLDAKLSGTVFGRMAPGAAKGEVEKRRATKSEIHPRIVVEIPISEFPDAEVRIPGNIANAPVDPASAAW